MNVHTAVDSRWAALARPGGDPIRLNHQSFVAIDRHRDAKYEASYRPQALYNRADEGFHANHEAFLLHEVSTNLPIYREDTGPTDFHLHLPPGGFQLVMVTSGVFTFDYDGRFHHVGPGTVMLQSAIVHRQLFYTWSGLSTQENLSAPQSVVPEPMAMGYSAKFLEAFITDPTSFPNPTIVGPDQIIEAETPRMAWSHPLHDRPAGAGFWLQDPLALDALYKPLAAGSVEGPIQSPTPRPCARHGHRGTEWVTWSPATSSPPIRRAMPCCPRAARARPTPAHSSKAEVVIYRVIRGSAEFRDGAGKVIELATGDVVTASRDALQLIGMGDDTQILRLGPAEGHRESF